MPWREFKTRRRYNYLFHLLCALAVMATGTARAADPAGLDVIKPKVRVQAPAFSLDSLDGGTDELMDYSGKVVLLNFWATWCIPCREEMPAMQRLWERYRDQGLVILAISVDRTKRKHVASFVNKQKLNYPILMDPEGEVRNRYEVVGLPMSYLIGRDGKISGRVIGGANWDSSEAYTLVEQLLQ